VSNQKYLEISEAFIQLDQLISWAADRRSRLIEELGITAQLESWNYAHIVEVGGEGVEIFYDNTWGTSYTTLIPIEALVGTEQERHDFILSMLTTVRETEVQYASLRSEIEKAERFKQYESLRSEFAEAPPST